MHTHFLSFTCQFSDAIWKKQMHLASLRPVISSPVILNVLMAFYSKSLKTTCSIFLWHFVVSTPTFFLISPTSDPSDFLLNRAVCHLYSTERDMPWSITVIVVMSRIVMGIKILNSCRWSGGNKTPGVNLVIKCRFTSKLVR
jgi:hypothetical protein